MRFVAPLMVVVLSTACARSTNSTTASPGSVSSSTADAAMATSPDTRAAQAEVLAVVNRLWESMRTNDSAMARSVFDSTAQFVSIVERNGTRTVRWSRADGFIRAIGTATEPWIERMVAPEVRVDQNLASVWTWYDFTRGGVTSHCGYDSIELARLTTGWKIIYIADTRQTTGCKAPAAR